MEFGEECIGILYSDKIGFKPHVSSTLTHYELDQPSHFVMHQDVFIDCYATGLLFSLLMTGIDLDKIQHFVQHSHNTQFFLTTIFLLAHWFVTKKTYPPPPPSFFHSIARTDVLWHEQNSRNNCVSWIDRGKEKRKNSIKSGFRSEKKSARLLLGSLLSVCTENIREHQSGQRRTALDVLDDLLEFLFCVHVERLVGLYCSQLRSKDKWGDYSTIIWARVFLDMNSAWAKLHRYGHYLCNSFYFKQNPDLWPTAAANSCLGWEF